MMVLYMFHPILLVQEIRLINQLRLVVYPMDFQGFSTIPGGSLVGSFVGSLVGSRFAGGDMTCLLIRV